MLRTVEEKMAHESEQQDVVEGVITSLQRLIEDDYLTVFMGLAIACLMMLDEADCLSEMQDTDDEFGLLIANAIATFTGDEIERKHLLALVTKKLIAPVLDQHASNYLRELIADTAAGL